MGLHLSTTTGPGTRWTTAELRPPSTSGFLHVAIETGRWPLPIPLPSRRRRHRLARLQSSADELRRRSDVLRADVFRGVLRPPGTRRTFPGQPAGSPRYDVVLLVETVTPQAAAALADLPEVTRHGGRVFAARNVRSMGEVDRDRQGIFLFNYFVADDVESNLDAWQYTAGWFQAETGLDNSLVLQPLDPGATDHTLVNHCRWDRLRDVVPSLVGKPSFHTFVLSTFQRRRVAPRPLLYRLAS